MDATNFSAHPKTTFLDIQIDKERPVKNSIRFMSVLLATFVLSFSANAADDKPIYTPSMRAREAKFLASKSKEETELLKSQYQKELADEAALQEKLIKETLKPIKTEAP